MSVYTDRREKLRPLLKRHRVEAMLVTNVVNVRYLTGFTGDSTYLVIGSKDEVLLSDGRYTTQLAEECPDIETRIRDTSESMPSLLGRLFGRKRRTLGYEADSVTVATRDRIAAAIAGATLVPLEGVVEQLRSIKDKTEIAAIRKAIVAAGEAFTHISRSLTPEMTEIDLRNELEYRMRLAGAEEASFPTIVAVGARAALPHAHPTMRRLGASPLLLIDWGAKRDGYLCDLTRTLFLKEPSPKLRKCYAAVAKAQQEAIAAIQPGKTCHEIDAVARNVLEKEGLGNLFTHGLGHSFGMEIHENPRFAPPWKTPLEPGMVMTVEPGIYLPGKFGIRIEDDILVTKNGCEILTASVPY